MRHGNKFNHLGRKAGHRAALLSSLAFALIKHKRINTTLAKAKALRVYVEPLITKSKENTTHSRRTVFSYLGKKEAIIELFDVIGPKVADRPGGYTRIIKMGYRRGDAAAMAMIELVDFNELMLNSKKKETEKTAKRTRRKSTSKSSEAAPVVVPPVVKEESKKEPEAKKEEE
jgi:large subunit ribosomal protein L17